MALDAPGTAAGGEPGDPAGILERVEESGSLPRGRQAGGRGSPGAHGGPELRHGKRWRGRWGTSTGKPEIWKGERIRGAWRAAAAGESWRIRPGSWKGLRNPDRSRGAGKRAAADLPAPRAGRSFAGEGAGGTSTKGAAISRGRIPR